jgi:hypothetical protein
MGTAGAGISRHRPGRHPAARADRPGRRGGHRAVGLLRGDRDLRDRADPAQRWPPRPPGRVTWLCPGARSSSACSSPTAGRPPGALAAEGIMIPSQRGQCCTRSAARNTRESSSSRCWPVCRNLAAEPRMRITGASLTISGTSSNNNRDVRRIGVLQHSCSLASPAGQLCHGDAPACPRHLVRRF